MFYRRHIALLLIACLAVAGLPARAALDEGFLNQPEPDPVEIPERPAEELPEKLDEEPGPPDTELRAGVATIYYDYKETLDPPLKSTESGVLFGPTLGFNHELANGAIFHMQLDFLAGSTIYDGTTQSGVPVLGSTTDTLIDLEGQYGHPFYTLSDTSRWRLLLGGAMRYWRRSGQYREDYRWFDVHAGTRYENEIDEDFAFQFEIALHYLYAGRITVFFSGYDSSLRDATGLLDNDFGLKVQIPILLFRTSYLPLVVTPWLEYIRIGEGGEFAIRTTGDTLYGTAHEPASQAWRIGIQIGTSFWF